MSTTLTMVVQSVRKTVTTSMAFAIFVALSLASTSIALIFAATNPAMNGQAIAAVAGLLILASATVVTTLSVVYRKFLANTIDHWVYW